MDERIRISLSPYLGRLVNEVSKLMNSSRTNTVEMLLYRIELLARHGKLSPDFGLDWLEAAAIANASGLGARHEDPVTVGGGEHVKFDVTLLETNNRSKSGFAGVYATAGSTFRALVPDVEHGGSRYLPSRPTSILAAIDRFKWFEQWGLPYGNIARNVEHWMKMRPQMSQEEILVSLVEDARAGDSIDIKHPYTLAQAEHALASLRRNLNSKQAPQGAVPPTEENELVCSVCWLPITDANDVSLFGKEHDAFAHKACA